MSGLYRYAFEFYPSAEQPKIVDTRSIRKGLDQSAPQKNNAFTASDGMQVPYRLWALEAPRGLALLLHGAFDYSGAFNEIGPQFAARGITAMAIDQRGFGATSTRGSWPGEERMTSDATEAISFLRSRCGSTLPCFIVGESMGASLAVYAASRAPELNLAGLVLAAPGAVSGIWRCFFGVLMARLLGFCTPNSEFTVERLSHGELTPASALRLMKDPMVLCRIHPASALGLFHLVLGAVKEAEHVRVPVLTMTGTKDGLIGKASAGHLYTKLAVEKEWESFEGGPHLLMHWKHNDRVLEKVFSWIGQRTEEVDASL